MARFQFIKNYEEDDNANKPFNIEVNKLESILWDLNGLASNKLINILYTTLISADNPYTFEDAQEFNKNL